MRKAVRLILTIAIGLLLTVCVSAQTVNVPDTAFKTALIKAGVDKNNDGEIQTDEAVNITELKLNYGKIVSLQGIEAFVSLKVLQCNYNKISSIDMSNNLMLEELHLIKNEVTRLDMSKNTRLKVLKCSGNKLSAIDVTGCKELTHLFCTGQLTELDVTQNPNMVELKCSFNKLKQLDISKNTMLKIFWCNSNSLTELDIRVNIAIEDFSCLNNPGLKKVCLSEMQLKMIESQNGSWTKDDNTAWSSSCN